MKLEIFRRDMPSVISTQTSKKQLWAVGSRGIFRYEPETDSFFRYPPLGNGHTAYIMHQDNSGNYWIGRWGRFVAILSYAQKGGHYKKHNIAASNNKETGVESILFSIEQDDTFGYLWMLSYAGLHAFKYTDAGTLEKVDIDHLVDTHMMYTRYARTGRAICGYLRMIWRTLSF